MKESLVVRAALPLIGAILGFVLGILIYALLPPIVFTIVLMGLALFAFVVVVRRGKPPELWHRAMGGFVFGYGRVFGFNICGIPGEMVIRF